MGYIGVITHLLTIFLTSWDILVLLTPKTPVAAQPLRPVEPTLKPSKMLGTNESSAEDSVNFWSTKIQWVWWFFCDFLDGYCTVDVWFGNNMDVWFGNSMDVFTLTSNQSGKNRIMRTSHKTWERSLLARTSKCFFGELRTPCSKTSKRMSYALVKHWVDVHGPNYPHESSPHQKYGFNKALLRDNSG